MSIYKVRKRNWSYSTFDRTKIENAVSAAINAIWWQDFSQVTSICDKVIQLVIDSTWSKIPDVELIQDKVEEVLIKEWHDKTAKAYILYRQKRAELRKDKNVVIEVWNTIEEYVDQKDWRVSANSNSWYSIGGLILNSSGKITANYWLSHIYSEDIGSHHRTWDFHIHDLDMLSGYCAGWSLRELLEQGFNWVENKVWSSPANNLQSAISQMVNFLWTLQNEWAWAQAFSSFDTYLSPFVHKYSQSLKDDIKKYNMSFESQEKENAYIEEKTYKYVLQNIQSFIFSLNFPSRWGSQTPFTNITLDYSCPKDLREKALLLGWQEKWYYCKTFWELDKERKMINRALCEVYITWDSQWRIFTFPIPTYNITEDFPWSDPEVDMIFEMTAKYWIPYFQNFVWSRFTRDKNWKKIPNPNAYTVDAVRSMCCRLQLDLTELTKRWNWLFGSAEMTGSIWVVTINLARIWYNFKGNEEWFFAQLDNLMEKAKISLEVKRKAITNYLVKWFYPYTYRYLKSFRNHFATIWINGMNEAILNFTNWKIDISKEEWKQFALKVLDHMRAKLKSFQEETWNLYNLEATPAEWTTYRFAKEDQKSLPWIIQAWTKEAPYYTNSTQLPVGHTDDVFEACLKQDELQCKYTWWTVLHLYMWERISSAEACKKLIKKTIENFSMPYITVTPTFSICPKHWYLSWEYDYCPKCDDELKIQWKRFDSEYRKKYIQNLTNQLCKTNEEHVARFTLEWCDTTDQYHNSMNEKNPNTIPESALMKKRP